MRISREREKFALRSPGSSVGQSPLHVKSQVISMALRWRCMSCALFCVILSELLTHLNTIHRDDNDFSQNCGLPDCSSKTEYTSANSFVKHVRNRHRTLLNSTYEAVFDRHQDIHVSNHDSECHVSDTGNVFYFIFHSHHGYHELRVNIPLGGGERWMCLLSDGMLIFGNNFYYFHSNNLNVIVTTQQHRFH